VQGIERDDAVRNLEFAKQLLRGGDLVGFLCDVDVRQDQSGVGVESMQQLGGLAVAEIVEASPERLPIQRDGASRWIGCGIPQTSGVAAEHLLDWLRIEALQDVADGGMGRGALPAQTEGDVQSATVHLDKGLNGTEGIAAGNHGEDGEQQNIWQLVELAFGSTRVGDLGEHGEKLIEGAHGNLLVIRLPGIDSEILPRRNPPTRVGLRNFPNCCAADSPSLLSGIER
jgi:hypothetical protein